MQGMGRGEAACASEPKNKKAIVVKSNNVRNGAQTMDSVVEHNPYHQHDSDGDNGNSEEDEGDEVYEESDEDTDEEAEEDPEEEIHEESDEYEEVEEELDDEEYEEHQQAGESDNAGIKNLGNEDPKEERGKKAVEEIGVSKVTANDESTSKQQQEGGSTRKQRLSRWDHKQEEEAFEIDVKRKRRKTRWDTNDSQDCLPNPSDFSTPLELLADPKIVSLKVKLMEINKKLQSSVIYDERPAAERSPSPEPEYNNLGIRINTRDARIRKKLMSERQNIMSKLAAKAHMALKSPPEEKRIKLVKKLFVPEKQYPTYNFIGLILGPKGNTQKKMEKETGAKIFLRGKGSGESETEDLHVRVEADSQQSLDAAALMIEKLLIPVADQNNDHKRAQLAELAKLRGTYVDNNVCELCKEKGHKKYACPLQDSTFKSVCCDVCGSFGHATSNCTISQSHQTKSNNEVDPAKLYVGYLSQAIDERRLKELFLPFGKILNTAVIKDQATGLSKGYGFVNFETPSDAAAAVTYMNGYKMDGKMLAVRIAGKKTVPVPAVPTSMLGQPSYSNGPMMSMLPEAPLLPPPYVSIRPMISMLPEAPFLLPPYVSNRPMISMLPEAPLIPPPYVVSSKIDPMAPSNSSSGFDFCDKIPNSLPESVPQFPGHPDYGGSEFKSFFTSPTMNENQRQMPETEKRSSFWAAPRFP